MSETTTNNEVYDEDFLDQPRDDVYDLEEEEFREESPVPNAEVVEVLLVV